MAAFASKAPASDEKLRGGYYTPTNLGWYLASWANSGGGKLLEPSCGDGAILEPLESLGREVQGVELNPDEAAKARTRCGRSTVEVADFFKWFDPSQWGAWDGVAGNPPFIRYQNWAEPTRGCAFDLMRMVGMRPNKLTNAWVPFVVASSLALRNGGRFAMVIPAELLQVTYAAELRAFLVDEFESLTIVAFNRLVFDGVLQEVVLLLGARGCGPAEIRVVEVDDVRSLEEVDKLDGIERIKAPLHSTEKWTKYLLDAKQAALLRQLKAHPRLPRLGEIADIDVGIVTGRNRFFVMRPSDGVERQVQRHLKPLVSRSAHLSGVRLDPKDMLDLEKENAQCRLLAISEPNIPRKGSPLRRYIEEGEAAGVHQGYKCSIRNPWWRVPSQWIPDAFLLRQIYDHPRIIANLAGATSTDTIHRVRLLNGDMPAAVAAASINSATFAFSEILGRSYGGGVLELEPREAEDLPFPDPSGLDDQQVTIVDGLLRSDRLNDALDRVDSWLLVERCGLSQDEVNELRSVWERLRDRRLTRGKSSKRVGTTLAA